MIVGLFAIDSANGMGIDNSLPWPRNQEDMQWFKSTTENQVVVMGKNTWNSKDMPVPLPKRINVLVTTTPVEREDIIQVKGNLLDNLATIQHQYSKKNIFVIGGPNILVQAKPILEKLYITRIPGNYACDVKIDLDSFLKGFKLISTANLSTCKIETYETISRST